MAKQGISPLNLAGTMFVLIAIFRGYFLRDQRIAEKGRTEEICKIGTGSEGFLARSDEKQFIVLVGLDMCQKGKKQGVNRGFYRCVVGPKLVQEKLTLILRERSSNGDINRQRAII